MKGHLWAFWWGMTRAELMGRPQGAKSDNLRDVSWAAVMAATMGCGSGI